MADILIRKADRVVTMDAGRRELADADIRIRDGVIAEIKVERGGTGLLFFINFRFFRPFLFLKPLLESFSKAH